MSAPAAERGHDAADAAPPTARRTALIAFVHLAALWGFAVAQPLFDLLGRNAEFFATRGSEGVEVVGFAVLLALVPPAAMVALEILAAAARRSFGRALHLAFVAALVALLVVQILKRVGALDAAAILVIAAVAGIAAAVAYARTRGLRTFLTALAPAPLVFLALFLGTSPVAKLVFADEAAARSPAVAARAPVVLIVFDELPLTSLLDSRGRIDPRRYPNFAALARTSTWFRGATGVHDRTSKAVPAILTGRRPRPGGLPIAADHPESLFRLLGGAYRMNVFEEATSVCPDDLCRATTSGAGVAGRARSLGSDLAVVFGHVALPDELAAGLPTVSEGWEGFAGGAGEAAPRPGPESPAEQRRKGVDELASGLTRGLRGGRGGRFDEFVSSLGAGSADRVLSFEHAFFPHAPFEHLPSGRRYAESGEEAIEGLVPASGTPPLRDRFAAAQAYQRHLLQTAYTDRLLGRVLERLRERETFDRSLVVITADHGATFRAGEDRRTVTRRTFADVASIPLLVKAPDQRQDEVNDAPVQTTDIVPTVADVLGVRLPWRVDGRSGFDRTHRRPRTVTMIQGSERRARISRGANDRPVTVTPAELAAGRGAALERKLALFGALGEPDAFGPRPELHGRALRELPPASRPARDAGVELDGASGLRNVDPSSGFVPAHLTGRVRSATPRKRLIAVAVNGRVVATAQTLLLAGDESERLSVMVPEPALRPGPNEVEILEVAGSGARPPLISLGRFGAPGGR